METINLARSKDLPSQRLRAALASGDRARAQQICPSLAAEFLPTQQRLRRTVEVLLRFHETVFRRAQAAIADRIAAAVDAGDQATALALLEVKRERQYRPLHYRLIDYKASSYDWPLLCFGPAQLRDCHLAIAKAQKAGFTRWEGLSIEEFVRQAARIFALHLGRTRIVDEPDRYRFVLDPCGTGGRMAAGGSLTNPGSFHATVPGAHDFTFGRADFPAYCAHCACWNELAPIAWFGHPQWVFTPWQQPGDPCSFSIYKDPNAIPAEHYTALGLAKPGPAPLPKRAETPPTREDLDRFVKLPSDLLREAIDAGDWARARALCPELAGEFVLMIKGLRLALEPLAAYNEALFGREQAALAGQIAAAVEAGDDGRALGLLDRKLAQHRDLADRTLAFIDDSLEYHRLAYGDAGLEACHRHLAG